MRNLFIDCDGVLADFDRGAERLLGMPPKAYQQRWGMGRFWAALAKAPDFFATLPLRPDAMILFRAVQHLHPTILTGLPYGNWAAPQKKKWAAEYFPRTKMITCMAIDKRKYCTPGDVLVDDSGKYSDLWEHAGGVFIHHVNAAESLKALAAYHDLGIRLPAANPAPSEALPGSLPTVPDGCATGSASPSPPTTRSNG